MQQTGQGLRLLVAYCQPQAVLEKIRLVEAAGLHPIMVGAGELDLANAFAFSSESFFKQTTLFVEARENKLVFAGVENGSPVFYRERQVEPKEIYEYAAVKMQEATSNGHAFGENGRNGRTAARVNLHNEIQKIAAKWQRPDNALIDRVVCIGDGIEAETFLSKITVEVGAPLKGLLRNGPSLPSRYSLAAGLALKKYFPLLNVIDLLPEEKKVWRQQQQEKQQALKIILAVGSFCCSFCSR